MAWAGASRNDQPHHIEDDPDRLQRDRHRLDDVEYPEQQVGHAGQLARVDLLDQHQDVVEFALEGAGERAGIPLVWMPAPSLCVRRPELLE